MKKNLFITAFLALATGLVAQTPRMCLYEEFTGETCPPCAATNPGLNTLLTNTNNINKVVAIKWQVDIPSAPSNTWSLYQTNKAEIRWRAYSYGYGINSAPSGRMDGQNVTTFGASSDHPANLSDAIINTAQSYTSPFSVTMNRAWNTGCSAVIVTVNITASANYTATGNLIFRTVMVERVVDFSVQPGTNGEKHFEDVAIKSFPSIQGGTSMVPNWVIGQTQTFTLNCPLPSYTRKKSEVAMVGFIEDDGNRKIQQAVRADKVAVPTVSFSNLNASVSKVTCSNAVIPVVTVRNDGPNALSTLTIIPYNDGVAGTPFTWNGSLASGATTSITMNTVTTPNTNGMHVFSFDVILPGGNYNLIVNSNTTNYFVAGNYQTQPVVEGFLSTSFPPTNWGVSNIDGGPAWSRQSGVGAYQLSSECAKYDFYNNAVVGDKDELYLPPMNLSGPDTPTLTFDVAYCQRTGTSNDMLEFFASYDCGATWQNFYSNAGTNLNTAVTGPQSNAFTPSDPSQWRPEMVVLTGFNKPNVISKFVVTNDHGNNLFIDNVNLAQTVGLSKYSKQNSNLILYPNPANETTTIKFNSSTSSVVKINVINAIGDLVYSKQIQADNGNNFYTLDTKEFSSGIYSVIVDSNGSKAIKKLTVVK